MKINLGKLLRVLGRVIVAAPVIIDAVGPVLRKRKARPFEGAGLPPAGSEPVKSDAPAPPA